MSRLDALIFFWRRRVYGDSCKTFPFGRFQNKLSCHFAWQAWHFVTFSRVCKSVESRFVWQAQNFGDLHPHFTWQAQHFRRVMLRVFG